LECVYNPDQINKQKCGAAVSKLHLKIFRIVIIITFNKQKCAAAVRIVIFITSINRNALLPFLLKIFRM